MPKVGNPFEPPRIPCTCGLQAVVDRALGVCIRIVNTALSPLALYAATRRLTGRRRWPPSRVTRMVSDKSNRIFKAEPKFLQVLAGQARLDIKLSSPEPEVKTRDGVILPSG